MPLFFDTSALFKRYQVEPGTAQVTRLLESPGSALFISSITIIEVVSNLKRLCDIDRITTESQFRAQRDFFFRDIEKLGISVVEISPGDIRTAESLIIKRYMKPVDSIQLAVALNLAERPATFVSSDRRLCAIAAQEGLKAVTPR